MRACTEHTCVHARTHAQNTYTRTACTALHWRGHVLCCALAAERPRNLLRVCVGTGHHTKGPTARAPRLAASVGQALEKWGVQFRVLQPGLLEIVL